MGGILVSNVDIDLTKKSCITEQQKTYIKNVMSYHIQYKDEICQKRLNNYKILAELLNSHGFGERFERSEKVIPAVFMFTCANFRIDLDELKNIIFHMVFIAVFFMENKHFLSRSSGIK